MRKFGGLATTWRGPSKALLLVSGALVAGLFLVVALSQVFGQTAHALQAGDIVMELKPAEQNLSMVPGRSYQGTLTISNVGRLDLHFRVFAKPYSVNGENYEPDYTTESIYTQLASWIQFAETSYELAPGDSAEVAFRVTVPNDVPSGGQYAAIIAETRDGVDEDSTIRQVNQLAGLIYGKVDGGNLRESGVVREQQIPQFVLGGDLSVYELTENTGNIDFQLTHAVSVMDFFTGNEVFGATSANEDGQTIGSARQMIFPGTKRPSTLTWTNSPQLGVFRVTETVSFLDQNFTYEQMVFIVPFWLVALVGGFIVLMILWLVLRIRRRHRNRPQVI